LSHKKYFKERRNIYQHTVIHGWKSVVFISHNCWILWQVINSIRIFGFAHTKK